MVVAGSGCDSPPQILDISPARGAVSVHTNEPVRITFDRPVDRGSVAARFHLAPGTSGEVAWEGYSLVYQHSALRPDTEYQVILDAGYRDAQGVVNTLRHGWRFHTEPAPMLASANPGHGERNVDPVSFLDLTFSREMNLDSLRGAVSFNPRAAFTLRADPADARRVVVAPQGLLRQELAYSVTIGPDALDLDGNHLARGSVIEFATGAIRPLHHWIGFVAGGDAAGVWMVDENRLPRQLYVGGVNAFSWSADGTHLLFEDEGGSWFDLSIDGASAPLPFQATWAAFLADGLGYAYIQDGELRQLPPNGQSVLLASGVREAAVAPNQSRIAFSVPELAGTEIRVFDVDLRSQYRLQSEAGAVSGLAWSSDGLKLAYLLEGTEIGRTAIRVRPLTGSGAVTTIATGDVARPAWQADSLHLVFSAMVVAPGGSISRVFRVSSGAPPVTLTLAQGMPVAADVSARDPAPSPDGHQIAFLADRAGSSQVWLMNADGTALTQLTGVQPGSAGYSCRALSWSRS